MDDFLRARHEAACLLAVYNYHCRTRQSQDDISRAHKVMVTATKEMFRVRKNAKDMLQAVLSDLAHADERIVSTQRAALLASINILTALEIIPEILEPIEPGRQDFWSVQSIKELTY